MRKNHYRNQIWRAFLIVGAMQINTPLAQQHAMPPGAMGRASDMRAINDTIPARRAEAEAVPNCRHVGADTLTDPQMKNRYIVVLRDSTMIAREVAYSVATDSTDVKYTFQDLIVGFAARLTRQQVDSLCADPAVESIDDDGYITLGEFADGDTPSRDEANVSVPAVPRTERTLRSFSQARMYTIDLPVPTKLVPTMLGSGVQVYLVDSGIRASHQEFGTRVGRGAGLMKGDSLGADCFGHGTHVGGTIAGNAYGVAPLVTIHPVRVIDCTGVGTVSSLIAGLEWISTNLELPAVVNISLGAWKGDDNAGELAKSIENLIAKGAVVVAAAGNTGADACQITPAFIPSVITVAASTDHDERWKKSNVGTCVDIFAPGAPVRAASMKSDMAFRDQRGTSMATAVVSGAVALYLEGHPKATPQEVQSWLVDNSSPQKLQRVRAPTPNRLLHIPETVAGN